MVGGGSEAVAHLGVALVALRQPLSHCSTSRSSSSIVVVVVFAEDGADSTHLLG